MPDATEAFVTGDVTIPDAFVDRPVIAAPISAPVLGLLTKNVTDVLVINPPVLRLNAYVELFRLKLPAEDPPEAVPPNIEAVAIRLAPCAVDPPPDAGVNAIAIAEA